MNVPSCTSIRDLSIHIPAGFTHVGGDPRNKTCSSLPHEIRSKGICHREQKQTLSIPNQDSVHLCVQGAGRSVPTKGFRIQKETIIQFNILE